MIISITGASGFIGTNLQAYLNSTNEVLPISARYNSNQTFEIIRNALIHLAGKAHDLKKISKDIYNISQKRTFEFVIGSRYMKGSTIVGWPLSRRIFSRILNMTIPLIFRLNCTDITNGLRGYSRKSISLILNHKPLTTGFIFLAEEALVITRSNVAIHEEPIEFHNRTHGETTVGFSEIRDSIKGLIKLLKAY